MKEVTYRELSKDDYSRIKELICEAFGFSDFIKNEKLLDAVLTTYLHGCIMDSSFGKVAVKDNNVIGIILGSTKNDKNNLKKFHNNLSFLWACTKLVFSSNKNKKLVKEFSIIKDTYKEIISGKENSFQGCIQLFIVSQESRGLGVGKTLVSNLFDYMKIMNVNSMYLYTDTRCNYGFYDNNDFNRINEKKIHFNSIDTDLDVFLYSYTF